MQKLALWSLAFVNLAALGALAMMIERDHDALAKSVSKSAGEITEQIRMSSPADFGHHGLDVRLFMIRSQLAQSAASPVIILGDSITEAALLPSSICGHQLVNAGIGGLDVAGYSRLVSELFAGMAAALFIVALGTNDAQNNAAPLSFKPAFLALVDRLEAHGHKVLLAGVTPIEMSGALARSYFNPRFASEVDAAIRAVAADRGVPFVDLRAAMKASELTLDGVHLNAAGYRPWWREIEAAANAALGCGLEGRAAGIESVKK